MIQTEQFTFPCVVEAAMANLWSVSLLKKNTDESVKKKEREEVEIILQWHWLWTPQCGAS